MAIELKMPQLGLTMETGTIVKWLKNEGDSVSAGEAIVEITTDKLTNEVESPADGVIISIVAKEGDELPVQAVLAYIGKAGESAPSKKSQHNKAEEKRSEKLSVVVIGGGPGGYVAAIRAAQLGADVTLVEKQHLGGTCLNYGCIPTKCLIESAELAYAMGSRAELLGVIYSNTHVDMEKVIDHKNSVSKKLTGGVAALMKLNGVKVIEGSASFSGSKQLDVKKTDGTVDVLSPDRIIIAVGSSAALPPIEGLKDNENCISSTQALSMTQVPESMLVLGCGVVGVELGFAYSAFGTKVTIIDAADKILPAMDSELTGIGLAKMKELGIDIFTGVSVNKVEPDGNGIKAICTDNSGKAKTFTAQKLLVATGRSANTDALNLKDAGISDNKGRIVTNTKMETNAPGIYAVGDCADSWAQLAGTASVMGEIAAENALGGCREYSQKTNPNCVHLGMDFAGVGITEDEAKRAGIEYSVGKFPLSANGKAIVVNGGEGMMKVIIGNEYEEILGVHIIGPHASDLIEEGALAIGLEATVPELCEVIHAHPTITEAFREAALHSVGKAIHTKNPRRKK